MGFTEIAGIGSGQFKTVPVLDIDGYWIAGSLEIAECVERVGSQATSLFPTDPEHRHARFVDHWVTTSLHPQIFRMIVHDIWQGLRAADQPYFRISREARLGCSLEDAHAARDALLPRFRDSLAPARLTLQHTAFLAGESPAYVDYLLFGALQWARIASDFTLLQADDPLHAWFDRIHRAVGSPDGDVSADYAAGSDARFGLR